jgi:putative transposase
MKEHRSIFGVEDMCRVFKVSKSGFYGYLNRGESKRKKLDRQLLPRIKAIFKESKETYGPLRIMASLRSRGVLVGKSRIARLMKENNLKPKTQRRFKVTTNSDHKRAVAPNLLNQNFWAKEPDQIWTGDITYIRTDEGWLYLAVVLDVCTRKIVGWSMDKRMKDDLVVNAFKSALHRRRPGKDFIFHSDRGSRYCSKRFKKLIKGAGGKQSMSATGSCYDNAITESFFGTLKRELVHHYRYQTRRAARRSIFSYIEGFCNLKRLHSSIGYLSPVEYEDSLCRLAA